MDSEDCVYISIAIGLGSGLLAFTLLLQLAAWAIWPALGFGFGVASIVGGSALTLLLLLKALFRLLDAPVNQDTP